MIGTTLPYQKQYRQVLGRKMAYVEVGGGDPIVFLHGNPASSYLWRNIIPYATEHGRCLAPDLIGMGDSDKLPDSGPDSYTFVEHRHYLDALLDQLGVMERATFVVHDWGSALGFDWAYRHPDAMKGIAYMEAIVKPGAWSEMSELGRRLFQEYRSSAGEQLILQENRFLGVNLPNTMLRALTDEEMANYLRPFAEPGEGRRPMLSWARQLPFDGEPADIAEIVTTYGAWLAHSPIPKLFILSEPGTMSPSAREFCRAWSAQSEVTVAGRHYPQEDSPDQVGQAIGRWLATFQ
jgi:haloalkane dehalogenase